MTAIRRESEKLFLGSKIDSTQVWEVFFAFQFCVSSFSFQVIKVISEQVKIPEEWFATLWMDFKADIMRSWRLSRRFNPLLSLEKCFSKEVLKIGELFETILFSDSVYLRWFFLVLVNFDFF